MNRHWTCENAVRRRRQSEAEQQVAVRLRALGLMDLEQYEIRDRVMQFVDELAHRLTKL